MRVKLEINKKLINKKERISYVIKLINSKKKTIYYIQVHNNILWKPKKLIIINNDSYGRSVGWLFIQIGRLKILSKEKVEL